VILPSQSRSIVLKVSSIHNRSDLRVMHICSDRIRIGVGPDLLLVDDSKGDKEEGQEDLNEGDSDLVMAGDDLGFLKEILFLFILFYFFGVD
jgi:hypothetical protein